MLGRFFFRWRGVIGFVAFGVVFWLARPTFGSCLLGLPIILAGLAARFWASGYIGIEGRAREIGARQRLASGPYRVLRHPLYIGNFLLVAGMLVALRPGLWLMVVVLAGFSVEYGLIIAAEEKDLSGRRSQMSDVRCEMSEVRMSVSGRREAGIGSPESTGEKQGTVNGENRGQSLGAPASNVLGAPSERAARYSPRFPRPCEGTVPVFRHGPESFLLSRALVEWRTWVATGAGFGLALLKAFVTR